MAQPKVITPPAESITRAEAKLQLRLITDPADVSAHPDDGAVDGLIAGARRYAEHYTGRSIGSQTLEIALDDFPLCGYPIELPQGPVTSLESVTYTDVAGGMQTLPSPYLDDFSLPARVFPAYGTVWPATRDVPNAVKVRYVAGAAVEPQVKNAMLLHIDAHYSGNSYTAQQREGILKAVDALLDTVKVYG